MEDLGLLNLPGVLAGRVEELLAWLKGKSRVVVLMSGGLDSGVLAYLCSLVLPGSTYGVTVKTAYTVDDCVVEASRMASLFNIFHRVLEIDGLDQQVSDNPCERCYFCKKLILQRVKCFAKDLGVETILDGSNLDDLKGFRPGRRALEEEGVLSPFILFGIGKKDLRIIASYAGLYFHDKPSESCLLTRFPYNTRVTLSDLKRVAEAERLVKNILNIRLVRVRDYGWFCRLELDLNDFPLLLDGGKVSTLVEGLKKLGYKYVTLDLEGYRSGSMDV